MHAHFFFCERQFFFTLALQGCAYVATLFGPPFARTARREEEGLLYFFPLIRTLLDEKGEFPFFLLLIFVRVLLAKKKKTVRVQGGSTSTATYISFFRRFLHYSSNELGTE
jgi:hypothetical protein